MKPGSRRCVVPALLLVVAAGAAQLQAREEFKTGSVTIATRFGELSYRVEVADTPYLRSLGLMYRASLPARRGMLLLNETPQRMSIWMKNTFVPLDIIYIDGAGRITGIVEDARPQSVRQMPSGGKALAALEVNAGQAQRHGIAVGDRVTWRVD